MTYFTFQTLLYNVNKLHTSDEQLYQSILNMPFDNLLNAYNALNKVVNSCLECSDIPELAFVVSDFANLCAAEIADRLNK